MCRVLKRGVLLQHHSIIMHWDGLGKLQHPGIMFCTGKHHTHLLQKMYPYSYFCNSVQCLQLVVRKLHTSPLSITERFILLPVVYYVVKVFVAHSHVKLICVSLAVQNLAFAYILLVFQASSWSYLFIYQVFSGLTLINLLLKCFFLCYSVIIATALSRFYWMG